MLTNNISFIVKALLADHDMHDPSIDFTAWNLKSFKSPATVDFATKFKIVSKIVLSRNR
jgi:hypothetical protein